MFKIQRIALDFTYIYDELVSFHFGLLCKFHTISKFKRINIHRLMLILSGDISLNLVPVCNSQSCCSNEWNVFRVTGIQLIYLNVNNILPKIDEIRDIVARTNDTVIRIPKSKLDETVLQLEIQLSNSDLLKCDKKKKVEMLLALLEVI